MANDRLYIVCKFCNEGFAIAKHYDGPWFTTRRSPEQLNEFLGKHYLCKGDDAANWWPHDCFILKRESDEDFDKITLF